MEVVRDKQAMREWSRRKRREGLKVALVPTMGFLHHGHLSLVKVAKQCADAVVVSVYVNPSQFAPGEDLHSYPTDLAGDLEKLKAFDVDVVFNPYDLYAGEGSEKRRGVVSGVPLSCLEQEGGGGSGHQTWIRVERLEKPLCGVSRPVFFRGVATVVAKLFHIVEPACAVFGKKDYQQWCVIKRMVRDLDFDVEVIGCPVAREADGLAMSSRNVRLSLSHRQRALSISRLLVEAKAMVAGGERDPRTITDAVKAGIAAAGGRIDYAEVVDQGSLEAVEAVDVPVVIAVAAWFGDVRLLDNVEIEPC